MKRHTFIRLIVSCFFILTACVSLHAADLYGPYHFEVAYKQVCNSEPTFEWRGQVCDSTGTYFDTVKATNPLELSTIYVLNLQFKDTITITRTFSLERGTSIEFRGRNYSQEGIYWDTAKITLNCDTIYRVIIKWEHDIHTYDTVHICETDLPYYWSGENIYVGGDYSYKVSFMNPRYDSIAHLHLYIHQPKTKTIHKSLCSNEYYQLGAERITEAGTYTLVERNYLGCIDTTHLIVTIQDLVQGFRQVHFCPNEGMRHNNGPYFTDRRTYYDTIPRAQQCDSVLATEYIPYESFLRETKAIRRPGEPYIWEYDSLTYTKDSTYVYRFPDINGCDSMYVLKLSTTYEVPVQYDACYGDTIMYKGKIITANTPFPFRDTLKTSLGADSILLISYNFHPRYFFQEQTEICEGTTIEWPGHTDENGQPIILSQSGAYYDRKKTIHGCDSVYRIIVTKNTVQIHDTSIFVCNDSLEDFRWKGPDSLWHPWYITDVDTTIVYYLDRTPSDPVESIDSYGVWHRNLSGGCQNIWRLRLVVKPCGRDTVPICPHGSVWINGIMYVAPGDYSQRFSTPSHINAQDSICRYHIYEAPAYDNEEYDTARTCRTPYRWHERKLYKSGHYTDTLETVLGCDSVCHLHLEVLPHYYRDEPTYHICSGDSVRIGNRYIKKTGSYFDSLITMAGCDSVIHYTINVVRSYHFNETGYIQRGGKYRWHRNGSKIWLNDPGVYFDSCQTVDGCDSVYTLTLHEIFPYHFYDSVFLCQDELNAFVWHKQRAYCDTTLYDSLQTRRGADSIYTMRVHVYPTYRQDQYIQLCHGEHFQIDNQTITQTGLYTDTLVAQHGCDSIIYYHISVHPSYLFESEVHLPASSGFEWEGHNRYITSAGIYTDSLKSALTGCDSIYRLKVVQDSRFTFSENIRICQSETPYLWHGHWFSESTDTTLIFVAANHTDSVHHLHLTVDSIREHTIHIDRCTGELVTIGSRTLSKSGIYTDSLRTAAGCDSIVRYIVNFHAAYIQHDTLHITHGTTTQWHGQVLDHAGVYWDSLRSQITGCDSIYRLELIVHNKYTYYDTVQLCQSGQAYLWHGYQLYNSCDTSRTYMSSEKTDSVYHLHLVILPSKQRIVNIDRCAEDYFFVGLQPVLHSGIWDDSLHTTTGCDSVIHYIVTYHPHYEKNDTLHIAIGEQIHWHGRWLSQTGNYIDSAITQFGCDSIHRLHLIVDNRYAFFDTIRTCKSHQPYSWHDYTLYTSCDTVRRYLTRDGRDSVYYLHLTIDPVKQQTIHINRCEGDYFLLRNQRITRSCIVEDTLFTTEDCDSIARYIFNFHPTFHHADTLYFNPGTTVQWHGQNLTRAGTYNDSTLTQNGCDSIYHLLLIESQQYITNRQLQCCANELPYYWHGIRMDSTGDYSYVQEDSLFYVHLQVHPTYLYESTADVYCDDAVYTFFGRALTKVDTTYEQQFNTIHGCDSIYRVTLRRQEPLISTQQYTICHNETIRIADTVVSHACQFKRVLHSSQGCDSTVLFIVNELPSFTRTQWASFCENGSYEWHRSRLKDTILTQPGTYRYSFQIDAGCDSIYELVLMAKKVPTWDTIIYFCPNEPQVHQGQVYTESHTIKQTYIAANGCDSLRYYHYILIPYCTRMDYYEHCPNTTFVMDGERLTQDGTYRLLIDKDTMHRFTLSSCPTYEYNRTIGPFCDSVTYDGTTYFARGKNEPTFTVDRYLHSQQCGCDSIEHLTMTIYQSAPVTTYHQSIYDYASVHFDGTYYDASGRYERHYKTSHGCDSTIVLELDVQSTNHPGALPFFYCEGAQQPIIVFNRPYQPTIDTTVLDTIDVPNSMLQIVRVANIEVEQTFQIRHFEPESEVCSSDNVLFFMNFATSGSYPRQYVLEFFNRNGLIASPKIQSGTISPLSNSIAVQLSGQGKPVHPGIYPYRIRFAGNECHLSDTILQGEILVRYPASVMEANWDNVVALLNANYNDGGWEFEAPFAWQIKADDGTDKSALVQNTSSEQPYLYSTFLSEGDHVIALLKRKGYADIIPSCEFIFHPVTTYMQHATVVTPHMVRRSAKVSIQSPADGQYRIVDTAGNTCAEGSYTTGTQTIHAPSSAGCYLIQLMPTDASIETQKLIVY